MERNFARLADGPFDVLVIGGGIHGAWVAYDAALRGLRVALVERRDWAAATSSASSKLIHGGLRYLEHGHLSLVRKALEERSRLLQLAPHRIQPLRFVLPLYEGGRLGALRLRLGLRLYDRLAGRSRLPIGPSRIIDRSVLVDRYGLKREGLRGGFVFGDCLTDDARLTLELVAGALDAGAVAVNHASVTSLEVDGRQVVGAEVMDQESGAARRVRARVTVNCAGPWAARLVEPFVPGFAGTVRLTKGVHLVLPALREADAFLLLSNDDRRVVFLIPWYGRTLLGTTDTDYHGDPDDLHVEPDDVDYLLARVNPLLGTGAWRSSDVIASFAGLRTLPVTAECDPSAVSREWRVDEPLGRLLVPLGGKLTSARADAASLVDRVLTLLGRAEEMPSLTAARPTPWAPRGDYAAWSRTMLARGLALGLDEETAETCQQRFGASLDRLYAIIAEQPELAERVAREAPFCLAELVHAVRHEMALTLEDVLRRRVPLLLLARLGEPTLRLVVELVGQLLQWPERRLREELDALATAVGPAVEVHDTV